MGNRKYTTEFKLDAVRLALSSESSQAQVARDLGINEPSLYSWISQYRGDVLDNPNTLSPEQELVALKKENAQLKQEREILKIGGSLLCETPSIRYQFIDTDTPPLS